MWKGAACCFLDKGKKLKLSLLLISLRENCADNHCKNQNCLYHGKMEHAKVF